MVKSLIYSTLAALILLVGTIYEQTFIHRQFAEFHVALEELYVKTDEQRSTVVDVYAVQQNWLNKKKYLHAFIPHNEIKEVDLWLAESVVMVRDKEWSDALSKLEVLIELSEQIPKTFLVSIENIL